MAHRGFLETTCEAEAEAEPDRSEGIWLLVTLMGDSHPSAELGSWFVAEEVP